MNRLFDSHCHINFEEFTPEERIAYVREIEESKKLKYAVDIGCDLETSIQAVEDAENYSWLYAAVGVHPHDTETMDEEIYSKIVELARREKVVAIGEIGLDYHYDNSGKDAQRYWFRRQIRLANELGMPIVVHSRDAHKETMDILIEEGAFSEERKAFFPKRKGLDGSLQGDARVLIHCFSGSAEFASEYIQMGAWISIGGPVTFKNSRKTGQVAEAIPLEYILVETDSPYLTPEPYRGRQNKPFYVEYTARKIAEIKGMKYGEVADITCRNAEIFYRI